MTEEEFQEELSARDADIAELNDQNTELTLQKRAFSKELRTLKRQMGLLRCYHDLYGKDAGMAYLLGEDLFKDSKDPAEHSAREDIALVEDAHVLQIMTEVAGEKTDE